jgi:Spy/CpxP family protein refolding chaperone
MRAFLGALGLALALVAAAPAPALAQDKAASERTSAEWLALIQADRKAIVAKSMDLTAEESAKFWPLYETFQRELAVPRNTITRALLDYVAAGDSLTDANARRIVEQILAAEKDEARLRDKHFRRLLKVLPARKAARYMQIENKIQAVVRYEGARAVPLVH